MVSNHITACAGPSAGSLSTALRTRAGGHPLLATPFWGKVDKQSLEAPEAGDPLLLPTTHAASSGVLGQSPQVLIKIYWTHEISKKMTKLKRQVQYISVVHSVV